VSISTETTETDAIVEGLDWPATRLRVRNLSVDFKTDDGVVHAVDDLSFDLARSETLGIVGESGSAMSVTSRPNLGLPPPSATPAGAAIRHHTNLLAMREKQLQPIRGDRIAMIFQDALAALNPVHRVGDQIAEAVAVHHDQSRGDLRARAVELLDLVGIPQPVQRADEYPHQYSGGMRQRAMIAMAIANDPDVLIADEPTTALDVTIQAQVLDVLERVQERTDTAIILITHDLGVVAGIADRVLVMYAGREAEIGSIEDVFYRPGHPYTRGLLASLPRLDRGPEHHRLHRIKGQPPSLINRPPGCSFHPRCPYADLQGLCTNRVPEPIALAPGHESACHFATSLDEMQPV
jgi:oligopeptide/dipeptide ABC transporter ATP-binding protein